MLPRAIDCSGRNAAAPSDCSPAAVLPRAIDCSGRNAAAPSDCFPAAVLPRAIDCSGEDAAAPSGACCRIFAERGGCRPAGHARQGKDRCCCVSDESSAAKSAGSEVPRERGIHSAARGADESAALGPVHRLRTGRAVLGHLIRSGLKSALPAQGLRAQPMADLPPCLDAHARRGAARRAMPPGRPPFRDPCRGRILAWNHHPGMRRRGRAANSPLFAGRKAGQHAASPGVGPALAPHDQTHPQSCEESQQPSASEPRRSRDGPASITLLASGQMVGLTTKRKRCRQPKGG
jgi:hypothetical protein